MTGTVAPKTVLYNDVDPHRALLRVVVVPHAGAGTSSSLDFRRQVPEDWAVATVRLPGRESRIRQKTYDLPDLVNEVAAAICELPGHAPLVVLGVCSGAVLAFEAVRVVQRDAPDAVAALVVAAQWDFSGPHRPLLPLPSPTDELPVALDRLRQFGGVPHAIAGSEDLMRLMLPAVIADIRAVANHRAEPEPPLRCPLLTIAGDKDELCSPERMAGWSRYSDDTRQVRVPGGHLLLAENPAVLAEVIRGDLDRIRGFSRSS